MSTDKDVGDLYDEVEVVRVPRQRLNRTLPDGPNTIRIEVLCSRSLATEVCDYDLNKLAYIWDIRIERTPDGEPGAVPERIEWEEGTFGRSGTCSRCVATTNDNWRVIDRLNLAELGFDEGFDGIIIQFVGFDEIYLEDELGTWARGELNPRRRPNRAEAFSRVIESAIEVREGAPLEFSKPKVFVNLWGTYWVDRINPAVTLDKLERIKEIDSEHPDGISGVLMWQMPMSVYYNNPGAAEKHEVFAEKEHPDTNKRYHAWPANKPPGLKGWYQQHVIEELPAPTPGEDYVLRYEYQRYAGSCPSPGTFGRVLIASGPPISFWLEGTVECGTAGTVIEDVTFSAPAGSPLAVYTHLGVENPGLEGLRLAWSLRDTSGVVLSLESAEFRSGIFDGLYGGDESIDTYETIVPYFRCNDVTPPYSTSCLPYVP